MHVLSSIGKNCTEGAFTQSRESGCAVSFFNCIGTASKYGFVTGFGGMSDHNRRQTYFHSCYATSNSSHGFYVNSSLAHCDYCTASGNIGSGLLATLSGGICNASECTSNTNGSYGYANVTLATECTATNNTAQGFYNCETIHRCTGTGNGTYDAQYVDYLCGCTLTSKANVTDDADAPAYSGTVTVVTAVDFATFATTTKTLTIAADGRVTAVVNNGAGGSSSPAASGGTY